MKREKTIENKLNIFITSFLCAEFRIGCKVAVQIIIENSET